MLDVASSWLRIRDAFESVDWNFADASRRTNGEIHPYPARFIPEIPRAALQALRVDGPVLDPFCGAGTTLYEARRRGLQAIGKDLNPIACLTSRVCISEWVAEDATKALHHANRLGNAVHSAVANRKQLDRNIPRVDHWFAEWAQRALDAAVGYLSTISKADPWHDRVALAISASIVKLSRQESDTQYSAVDKPGDINHAARMLSRSLIKVSEWLKIHAISSAPQTVVLEGDARSLGEIRDASVKAAVFSPPYPNAYEYWLYHKYRMYWLGYDPISVRSDEIGARPYYSRRNGLTEEDFAAQMAEVFKELKRVLTPSSPVVVVVGDSVIGGKQVDNADLLSGTVAEDGFELIAHCTREILRRRSSFNSSHTRGRRSEHVLLYRSPA